MDLRNVDSRPRATQKWAWRREVDQEEAERILAIVAESEAIEVDLGFTSEQLWPEIFNMDEEDDIFFAHGDISLADAKFAARNEGMLPSDLLPDENEDLDFNFDEDWEEYEFKVMGY